MWRATDLIARSRALRPVAEIAIRRLRPFASGALDNHPLAPLAVLHLAGWLRTQDGMAQEAVRLLDQTLQEEKKTDESLTSLAEAEVNLAAAA